MKQTLLILFSVISLGLFGQNIPYTSVGRGAATSFVTDYQSLGVNSSALGWKPEYDDKKITFSTAEASIFFQSDSLNKQKFSNFGDILKTQFQNRTIDSNAVQSILSSTATYARAGVNIRASMLWLGGAYKTESYGGFAFSIQEDYGFSGKLNTSNASLFFQGDWQNLIDSASTVVNGDTSRIGFSQNLAADTAAGIFSLHLQNPLNVSSFTQGTNVKLIWNRNFNFGYGLKLFGTEEKFALFGGLGFRFIQSLAYYDLNSDSGGLRVNSSIPLDNLTSQGLASNINPFNAASIGGLFSKPIGNGFGLDFSASAIFLDKIRVAAAVNNIGSVKYNNFKYKENSIIPQEIAVSDYDPNNSAQTIQSIISGSQLLSSEGEEEIKVNNAANFRFGANIKLIDQLNLGMDFVAPFDTDNPLSLPNGIFAFGADFRPIKFISLNVGYITGGLYNGYVPLGINFILGNGSYEFGISSQDISHFITKNGNSVSAAFGFARFRI